MSYGTALQVNTHPSANTNSRIVLLMAGMLALSFDLSAAEVAKNPDGTGAYATRKYPGVL
jgi:hypothetical protein